VEIPNLPVDNPFENSELVFAAETRALPFPIVMSSADTTQTDTIKKQAQELHTKVYLEKGYITADEIDDDGIFNDEYADRSVYLFAENSFRDSTCRYIKADKKDGIMSLPTTKNFSVDPDILRDAAGVDRLSNIRPRDVIEVSALASVQHGDINQGKRGELDATRLLYARVLRDSLDQGHKLWVLNTHENLVRHLEILLGKEQIHRLGDTKDYMGSPTVPVAINPQEVVRTALEDETPMGDMKRQYLSETLQGVSDRHLDKKMLQLLESHGIAYERSPLLKRTLRHRKAIAYAAIAGYTAARAIPVAHIDGFEGNVGVFFAIDFATSFPYTWGLVEVVTARSPAKRIAGGAVAAGSFAAPYVYFWAEGNDYPAWVNGVVGGIVGVAGIMAVNGIRKDKQLEKRLEKDDGLTDLDIEAK
jgi:hypothetical protein